MLFKSFQPRTVADGQFKENFSFLSSPVDRRNPAVDWCSGTLKEDPRPGMHL